MLNRNKTVESHINSFLNSRRFRKRTLFSPRNQIYYNKRTVEPPAKRLGRQVRIVHIVILTTVWHINAMRKITIKANLYLSNFTFESVNRSIQSSEARRAKLSDKPVRGGTHDESSTASGGRCDRTNVEEKKDFSFGRYSEQPSAVSADAPGDAFYHRFFIFADDGIYLGV